MATETGSREFATPRLSEAQVFDAAKNLRRRYALYYLKREGEPVGLGELAEQIAAWENDTTVEAVTAEQRKSVYSALYQTHLPKLEEARVLTYDRRANVVEFTEDAENLDLYLASDPQTTIQWDRLYLGVGSGAVLSVLLSGLGVGPFAAIQGSTWAAVVGVVVTILALAHTYDRRRWQRRFDGAAPDFALELGEDR
jgi:hypothetical protein